MQLYRSVGGSVLELDSPRWETLAVRCRDADCPAINELLSATLESPNDPAWFGETWQYLCSEGTAYESAFAAMPYVVQSMAKAKPANRGVYLAFIGLVISSESKPPDDFFKDYQSAIAQVQTLAGEFIGITDNIPHLRYAIGLIARLYGMPRCADHIESLECSFCYETFDAEPEKLSILNSTNSPP